MAADAGDGHDTVLEWLPQRLEDGPLELRKLVEKKHAAVRECAGSAPARASSVPAPATASLPRGPQAGPSAGGCRGRAGVYGAFGAQTTGSSRRVTSSSCSAVIFGIGQKPFRAAHTRRERRATVIVTPESRLSHGAT